MDMGSYAFEVGALSRFWENSATQGPWRFISLTNTIHEISPDSLAKILVRCVERLDNGGCLFLYDMEQLPVLELGAIPWAATEMKLILSELFGALGAPSYEPSVGAWAHRTCRGWNAQIHFDHLGVEPDFRQRSDEAIERTSQRILTLVGDRVRRVDAALESLAVHGPDTEEEESTIDVLLHEFWALARFRGGLR